VSEPEVSWKALEQGARVYGPAGEELGKVDEIAGDAEADIFSGLVVSSGLLGGKRFLPAERVTGIWPDRVETTLTEAQAAALKDYDEPVAERWEVPEDLKTRLLRFFGFSGGRRRRY
jgi:hypothetical protein